MFSDAEFTDEGVIEEEFPEGTESIEGLDACSLDAEFTDEGAPGAEFPKFPEGTDFIEWAFECPVEAEFTEDEGAIGEDFSQGTVFFKGA